MAIENSNQDVRSKNSPVRFIAGVALILAGLWLAMAWLSAMSAPLDLWWIALSLAIAAAYCCVKGVGFLRRPRLGREWFSGWKWGLVKAAIAIPVTSAVCLYMVIGLASSSIQRDAGPFDRGRMEHIVEMAKQKHLTDRTEFEVDPSGNLVPWDPMKPGAPSHSLPVVSVDPKEMGQFVVHITTVDNGHAGYGGFIYYSDFAIVENGWLSEEKIDSHWVKFYDNNQ